MAPLSLADISHLEYRYADGDVGAYPREDLIPEEQELLGKYLAFVKIPQQGALRPRELVIVFHPSKKGAQA